MPWYLPQHGSGSVSHIELQWLDVWVVANQEESLDSAHFVSIPQQPYIFTTYGMDIQPSSAHLASLDLCLCSLAVYIYFFRRLGSKTSFLYPWIWVLIIMVCGYQTVDWTTLTYTCTCMFLGSTMSFIYATQM